MVYFYRSPKSIVNFCLKSIEPKDIILPYFVKFYFVLFWQAMKNLSIGQLLRYKRGNDEQTLHQVAISTNIDSTIISKIERGKRLPTTDQLKGFANHFSLPLNDLHAKLIAEQIMKDYGISQTTYRAVQIVQEEMAIYSSKSKKKNV